MDNFITKSTFIHVLIKWKWFFCSILLLSIVCAYIFSSPYFITPKYKSSVVFYPSNIAPYSKENETEQMLQWLQSRDIKDSVIKSMNLTKHYKIDSNYIHFYSELMHVYSKNISTSKTLYESIEVTALDKDPVMAKHIVDTIIHFLNHKIRRIHNTKTEEVLKFNQQMFAFKKQEVDTIRRALNELSTNYGIFDIPNQAREITKAYLNTGGSNSTKNNKELNDLQSSFKAVSGDYQIYSSYITPLMESYDLYKTEYERLHFLLQKEFTYTNIVSSAYVSDSKAYPIRWLIMVYTLIVSMVFCFIIVAIVEFFKRHHILSKKQDSLEG